MIPYLLVLSFVIFWINLEQKAINRKSFWLPLLILSLFAGIRSYHVGSDSINYASNFIYHLDIYNFEFRPNVELGYQLLSYFILYLTYNYFWLFFITALIVVYCYLSIIKKYSINYSLSVFFFITLGTYTFFFNGLRQGLAMAIFVLATPYLLERKFIPYLFICVLASMFHNTALFLIPFYFLIGLKIRLIYKILISFIISMLASSILITYLASTNEKYVTYADASEKAGGLVVLSFYTALVFIIYLVIYLYKIKEEYFSKLFAFYSVGVVFMIPVAMLGSNPSGPQRLLPYFTWPLILLLPIMLKEINNRFIYLISIILGLAYFFLTTSRFSDLVPYTINPIFEIF